MSDKPATLTEEKRREIEEVVNNVYGSRHSTESTIRWANRCQKLLAEVVRLRAEMKSDLTVMKDATAALACLRQERDRYRCALEEENE